MDLQGEFGEGVSFTQTRARTARAWVNRLWNDTFLSSCTHLAQGGGFVQDAEGNRLALHGGRMVYLLDADTGEWWTANGLPLPPPDEKWECLHAAGVSRIRRAHGGIASEMSVLVPRSGNGEWWRVAIENRGAAPRTLRVIVCADIPIGWFAGAVQARFLPQRRMLMVRDVVRTGTNYAHYTDGREIRHFLALDPAPDGFDSRHAAFVGPYDTLQSPQALAAGGCGGSLAAYERPILALQTTIDVPPGAAVTVGAALGVLRDGEDSAEFCRRAFAPGAFEAEVAAVARIVSDRGAGWRIACPDAALAGFANGWLKHQLRFNATWARVYYYGYRDLCQDCTALSALDPEFARSVAERVLAHQYVSGFAPRAWVDGQLVEQGYADSPVWIAPCVHAVAAETGDLAWLEKPIPFADGPSASVYEHAMRSLRHVAEDVGPHGLPRIRRGDWNDLLNGAGAAGRGESVWLAQALVVSLGCGAALARARGRDDEAAWADTAASALRERVNAVARKGDCYIRAFTDEGNPLFAPGSPEGIDLLAQAWAVLSGCAAGEDARRVMREVDRRLEEPMGTRTCERGFDGFRADVGYQSVVARGYNVNGGCYSHAAAFAVAADFLAGRPDAALRRLEKILPWTEARGRMTGEPFVINNGYHSSLAGQRAGDSDTGWITGTAGWVCRALLEQAFGLVPALDGLRVRPCLPTGWSRAEVVRRFRGTEYRLFYARAEGAEAGRPARVRVEGREWGEGPLPPRPGSHVRVDVAV